MRRINLKRILSFLSIGILVLIKIYGYLDNIGEVFSLNTYGTIEKLVNLLICFAVIYAIYGVFDLFKNSIIVFILDIVTSGLFIVSYKFISNSSIISYLIALCTIVLVFINLMLSIAIKNKNAKTKVKDNLISTILELIIALLLFFTISAFVAFPLFKSSAHININADKLSKNISLLKPNEDVYFITEQNPESGELFINILDENYKSIAEFNESTTSISFAKLYKNDEYSLIGIVDDVTSEKPYLINSRIEKICEFEDSGKPDYIEEYLLDLLNYSIENKLINYDRADLEVDMDENSKIALYSEKEFNGEEYESEDGFKYKYFENKNNSNYIIQIEYDPDIVEYKENVIEKLFDVASTNIDEENSLYNLERKYSLINVSNGEIVSLNCENLLFNEGIYSFADGNIPFYDEAEHGYFDLKGNKHIDDENELTINSYNNYRIVYDFNEKEYYIVDNINNENVLKEYDNIYTFENYIIGLKDKKYEILRIDDLSIIDEYIMKDFEYIDENSIEDEESVIDDISEEDAEEDVEEDTDEEEEVQELAEDNVEEELEEIEYVEDNRNNVIVYNNEELILLKNTLKNDYVLLHYDSLKNKVEILSESVQDFQALNKSAEISNAFYVSSYLF